MLGAPLDTSHVRDRRELFEKDKELSGSKLVSGSEYIESQA